MILSDPFNDFSVLPASLFLLAALIFIDSVSVLLPIEPVAIIAATVSPFIDPFALFLIASKLANIARAVTPGERAMAMHQILAPSAIVGSTVGPLIDALPLHLVVLETPPERAIVVPVERPRPMLLPVEEAALEHRPVRQLHLAEARLAVGHPRPLVNRPIGLDQSPQPMHFVEKPLAFVKGPSRPRYKGAVAMAYLSAWLVNSFLAGVEDPLSRVDADFVSGFAQEQLGLGVARLLALEKDLLGFRIDLVKTPQFSRNVIDNSIEVRVAFCQVCIFIRLDVLAGQVPLAQSLHFSNAPEVPPMEQCHSLARPRRLLAHGIQVQLPIEKFLRIFVSTASCSHFFYTKELLLLLIIF